MRGSQNFQILAVTCVALSSISSAYGDSFGLGSNRFEIDFIDVGHIGNAPAPTGNPSAAGSVDYVYRMAKHEVSRSAIIKASRLGGLDLTLADMSLHAGNGDEQPATGVSWFEAARFVNWLNESSGHVPAYQFTSDGEFRAWQDGDAGFDSNNPFRDHRSKYFLPSTDEWFKAAYYDPRLERYHVFPTGSDSPPQSVPHGDAPDSAVYIRPFFSGPAAVTRAGGLSPFGTMGQGGNVFEWEESSADLLNDGRDDLRGVRGGDWFDSFMHSSFRFEFLPSTEKHNLGFRVASVPEPHSFGSMVLGMLGMLLHRRPSRLTE